MKKTMISAAVAALVLLGGCGDKKSESAAHETKAPTTRHESAAKPAPASEAPVKEERVSAAPSAQQAETNVTEAAAAAATEAVEKAKEEAARTGETIAKSVEKAEEEAKSAVAEKAEAAQSAVDAAALYVKCAGCHGAKGEKHALGKSNIIAGQSKEELLKKIEGYKNGTYGGAMKGLMAGQVKSLTPEQAEALADYISKL